MAVDDEDPHLSIQTFRNSVRLANITEQFPSDTEDGHPRIVDQSNWRAAEYKVNQSHLRIADGVVTIVQSMVSMPLESS